MEHVPSPFNYVTPDTKFEPLSDTGRGRVRFSVVFRPINVDPSTFVMGQYITQPDLSDSVCRMYF